MSNKETSIAEIAQWILSVIDRMEFGEVNVGIKVHDDRVSMVEMSHTVRVKPGSDGSLDTGG